MDAILTICEREQPWMIDTIRRLVECESPSDNRAALSACADLVAQLAGAAGANVSRVTNGATADHIVAEWPGDGPPILLLGHFDTVWPVGQLGRMPCREVDGRLHGPGVFDMKAGIAIGLLAARALVETTGRSRPRLSFFLSADEEVGSGSSRAEIESRARQSAAVLVLEPSLPGGAVKTARKGVGEFTVRVHGIAAHAGVDPGAGASAIHELARQITSIVGLAEPARGLTINVGVVRGGTRSNVVAQEASARVDVRVARKEDKPRIEAAFAALQSADARVRVSVTGGINRPPLERTAGVVGLFERAQRVAAALGRTLAEGSTGGGSDGNFTASLGVPTLDGLGAVGDGAHAIHEHVILKELAWRAALVAGLAS